jgi:multidrug efflux pump subunit AcrA (membrane-fusion protein)
MMFHNVPQPYHNTSTKAVPVTTKKQLSNILAVVVLCAFILSFMSCAAKKDSTTPQYQIVTVERGDLSITVSVDGNLVMPQAFNLCFGTPGDVKDVLVEEGDQVKAGAILARLDDTAHRLDVKSANCDVQRKLSDLYETVPRLPQFPEHQWQFNTTTNRWQDLGIINSNISYPFYYPNRTGLTSSAWARDEVSRAHDLFLEKKYDEAISELAIAIYDLESCARIVDEAITNPESGLGDIAWFADPDETAFLVQLDQQFEAVYILELHKVVTQVRQGQLDVEKVRSLTAQGKYQEASPLFEALLGQMEDIGKAVLNNVNRIEARHGGVIYGKNICLYLYQSADDSLSKAFAAIQKDGIGSPEFKNNLRMAQHAMLICNAILGTNDYVLQHGLSLKNEQQYKLNLQTSLVSLGNSQDNFLDTIILAPFDGTVVSVGVKKNDVLSAQDYTSKSTIQLVDTTAIKFEGLVDEIDILKVKTGQKARITIDAMPNKVFTGRVSFISPYGEASTSNVVQFAVTLQLDPSQAELKGGLTATADIEIETTKDALLVPLRAVTTTPQETFVTISNETTGQTEKRKVTLGRQNLQFAEVLSGLNEGEKVAMEIKITGAPVTTGFPGRGAPPPPPR